MASSAAPDFEALATRAVAECPDLGGTADDFARHLEAIAARDASIDLASLRLDDLYLAWCCTRGCPRALEQLWAHHVPVIRQTAASVLGNASRADDVVQDVLQHVLVGTRERAAAIASYEGRSKLARWLRAVTVRAALTARQRLDAATPPGDDATALIASAADDPALALVKERSGETIEHALRRALASLEPDDRLILQQHLVDGLGIDQLARIYQIHRATAARRITKAQDALRLATRRYLREATQLLGDDLESLIRFAQSRVHLSLRSLARGPE
ncbi:MAG TPA: sigma-70 family RNA polymerase sigma factor [Kofleriaceae bacterium]|nr:sigma-70 family RNA polymerase sigma factor [Kofleriaceae bacterium]